MLPVLLLSAAGALSTLPYAQAAPAADSSTSGSATTNSCTSSLKVAVAANANTFASTSFDYIIVGGGTAGLALANRLSADSSLKIGVIEAGIWHEGDPSLDTPEFSFPGDQGNATYDWLFETTPQPGAAGRQIAQPRGKMMGGSGGLNLLAWNRASQPEYDAWQTFINNPTWSWSGLTSFFAKTQNVEQNQQNPFPGVSTAAAAASFTHGSSTGPINVSYNEIYTDVTNPYVQAYNNLGIETLADADSGTTAGIYNSRMNVERGTVGIRSYSVNSYFAESCSRSNLMAITGAQATKINLKATGAGYTATGVNYVVGGKSFTAKANKEVILSAGTVQTPQLLELSGIGNPTILKAAGITPLVNLPSVGENLQEHVYTILEWELVDGVKTFDILNNNATFLAEQTALYAKNKTGWLAATDSALAFMPFQAFTNSTVQTALLADFDAVANAKGVTPLQALQYKTHRSWITGGTVPMTEAVMLSRGLIAPEAGKSYLTMLVGTMHPMARGSVHISTSNATAAPLINGNYLNNNYDIQTILQVLKFALKLGTTAPLSGVISSLISPTTTDDASLITYIQGTLSPGDHLIGTATMASQAEGGVVNAKLLVYGTTNVRVVDASIIPMTIATHIQQTVYAIAEKAAGIILG